MTQQLQRVATQPQGSIESVVELEWRSDERLPTHLVGPFCAHAQSLTATTRLNEIRPGVQRATVLDPCYWSPEMPHLYRCEDAEGNVGPLVGLRHWRADGSSLLLDGRRRVLRGARVEADLLDDADWKQLHELGLTIVLDDPQVDACWLAAQVGVGVVVALEELSKHPRERLESLAACPAVLAVMLGIEWAQAVAGEPLSPGPLYGMAIDDELVPPPEWSQCMGVVLDEMSLADLTTSRPEWPLLVFGYGEGVADFADAVAACSDLQTNCAPLTDLAGYLVV